MLFRKQKTVRFRLLCLVQWFILLCVSHVALSQDDRVYLKSGEVYEGKIKAIHSDFILVETTDRIFSIDREDIQYVFKEQEQHHSSATSEILMDADPQEDYFEPVKGRFLTEFGGGLYTFNPFAYNLSVREWYVLRDAFNVGLDLSFDFFSSYMVKVSGHVRYFFKGSRAFKSYFTGGIGFGPVAGPLEGFDRSTSLVNYTPIVQPVIGFGGWLESGLGVAFTGELGFNFTAYSAEERIDVGNSTRFEIGQYRNFGPYLRMGMVF